MKKFLLLLCLFSGVAAYGQQSITDMMNAQANASGCGTAHLIINYSSGNYTSREVAVVSEDSANSAHVWIHTCFQDTSLRQTDTNFVLSANQLNALKSFYQSASNNNNPDPNVTAMHQGTASLKADVGSAGSACLNYSSTIHISLYRTLISNWNNWYK